MRRKPTEDGFKIVPRLPLPNPGKRKIGTSHNVEPYQTVNTVTGSEDVK
jgi:hypothetical protein